MRGDGSALKSGASGFSSPAGWAGATTSAAISGADAPARRKLRAWPSVIKRLVRVGRLEGRAEGWLRWATCAASPVRGEDYYRGPWNAATPNPILLINSRYDPNTGYGGAARAEQYLGNAVLLTHEGYGHLSFQDPSTCVDQAMVEYVTELITPPPGTVCQSDQQPFDPHFGARSTSTACGGSYGCLPPRNGRAFARRGTGRANQAQESVGPTSD